LYIANEAPHYPYQIRTSRADRRPGAVPDVDFPEKGSEKDYPQVYRRMVEILDESVGKTLATLRKLGLYDNTIVIFCSDNGAVKPGSNGSFKGFKGTLWEGGHREPAIIQWPGHIKAGWQSDETVMTMDILPTLVALTGGNTPNGIDGVSILNLLLHQKPLEPRSLFWQYKNSYAVRKQGWKLIIPGLNATPELYNLDDDLSEKNNLASRYPQKVAELLKELDEWKVSVAGHPLLTFNNPKN
jgi:arylsulfatase A-like enzyme